MELKDLKNITAFDAAHFKNDSSRITVADSLSDLRFFAKKILDAYDYVTKHDSNDSVYQLVFDSMKANINDYVQAFVDLVSVLYAVEGHRNTERISSVRHAIRFYTSAYDNYSEDCRHWIEFLQRRNELVHEYYNYEFLNEEIKKAMLNYSDSVLELVDSLQENLKREECLQNVIKKVQL